MASPWSGAAQSGSRDYEPADVERVLDAMPKGRQEAMTLRTFAASLSMEGRTVRAILSARDGVDFLLAYDNDLVWDAETFEEAIPWTETLLARATTEMARVARRERFARAHLQRQQPELIPS